MPQEIGSLGQIEAGGYAFRNLVTITFDVTPLDTGRRQALRMDIDDPKGRVRGVVVRDGKFLASTSFFHTYEDQFIGDRLTVRIVASGNWDGVSYVSIKAMTHVSTLDLTDMSSLSHLDLLGCYEEVVPSSFLPSGTRELTYDAFGGFSERPTIPYSHLPTSLVRIEGPFNFNGEGFSDMPFNPKRLWVNAQNHSSTAIKSDDLDLSKLKDFNHQNDLTDLDVLRGSVEDISGADVGDRRLFVENTSLKEAENVYGSSNRDLDGADVMPASLEQWIMDQNVPKDGKTFTDWSNADKLTYFSFTQSQSTETVPNVVAMVNGIISADSNTDFSNTDFDVHDAFPRAHPGLFPLPWDLWDQVKDIPNDWNWTQRIEPVRVKSVHHQTSGDDYFLCDDPNGILDVADGWDVAMTINCGDPKNNLAFEIAGDGTSKDRPSSSETRVYTSTDGEDLVDVAAGSLGDDASIWLSSFDGTPTNP